jgi:hypothetical protein
LEVCRTINGTFAHACQRAKAKKKSREEISYPFPGQKLMGDESMEPVFDVHRSFREVNVTAGTVESLTQQSRLPSFLSN